MGGRIASRQEMPRVSVPFVGDGAPREKIVKVNLCDLAVAATMVELLPREYLVAAKREKSRAQAASANLGTSAAWAKSGSGSSTVGPSGSAFAGVSGGPAVGRAGVAAAAGTPRGSRPPASSTGNGSGTGAGSGAGGGTGTGTGAGAGTGAGTGAGAGAGAGAGGSAASARGSSAPTASSATAKPESGSTVASRELEWEAEVCRADVVHAWNLVVRVGSMAALFTPGDWGRLYSMNKVRCSGGSSVW
jgi:hypothetical protein